MEGWIIGAGVIFALYIALRLALRHYFSPDTPGREERCFASQPAVRRPRNKSRVFCVFPH
jgi:hypothetical protein